MFAFSLYSIIDFFKFGNPTIVYFKDSTNTNSATLNLNDLLFMLQINKATSDDFILRGEVIFENDPSKHHYLRFEKCELGKNIDIKHKETINNFESLTKQNYNDYYCINKEDSNINIYITMK